MGEAVFQEFQKHYQHPLKEEPVTSAELENLGDAMGK